MGLFKDFEPYPMRYALTMAFVQTDNVILKLPKIIDLDQLKLDIAEAYCDAATTGNFPCSELSLQFINVLEGTFAKFYLVLTGGDLVSETHPSFTRGS
jgi:hypothetical protein